MSESMVPLPRSHFLGAAANKAAGSAPCKDCLDRCPACAGRCDKYKAWKAKRMEVLEKCHKEQRAKQEANEVHYGGMIKAIIRRGDKVGTTRR